MPIGAINQAGRQVMHLLQRLKNELKVNTTCGASNVSFGLPAREGISATFLSMAIGAGLTSAIMNPMHVEIVKACMAADVMMGHDPDCARWIRRFREAPPLQASGAAGRPRRCRPRALLRRCRKVQPAAAVRAGTVGAARHRHEAGHTGLRPAILSRERF